MKKSISFWKSIQFKYTSVIVVSIVLIIIGIIAFSENRQKHNIDIYNDRRVERQESFDIISSLETQNLRGLTVENTYWDDMVSFIAEPTDSFKTEVLEPQLDTYQANAIWTYDTSYQLKSNTNNLADGFKDFDLKLTPDGINAMFSEKYLVHFYRNTPMGIMEVYGATVHPSTDVDHKTTPQGYFYIARILDSKYITKLESATKDEIKIVTDPKLWQTPTNVDPEKGEFQFNKELNDETARPIAALNVSYQSTAIAGLFESLNSVVRLAILFFAVITLLFYLLLRKLIISPLTQIYFALSTENVKSLVDLKTDNTEFGHIAQLIENFQIQKEEIAKTAEDRALAQASLEARTKELETINSLMVDRELKMIELKKELSDLKAKVPKL